MKEVPQYIEDYAKNVGKLSQSRKVEFLSFAEVNDPFFELLGYIRDQNNVQ